MGAPARHAAPAGSPRLLRPRPRAGTGRARRRRHGEDAEARTRASRTVPRTSRSCTSGRPGFRATSARSSAFARRRHAPVVVEPGRRRLPRLGGRPNGGGQPAAAPGAARRRRTCSTRASSRSSRADLFLGEPTASWEILPNAVDVDLFTPAPTRPPDGPVLMLGGDQTQAYRARARAADARAWSVSGIPERGCSSPAGSSPRSSRWSSRAGHSRPRRSCVGEYAQRDCAGHPAPRASAAAHEGQGPVPDARDRGDGVRAAGRLSGERRDGRARRRRGGNRRAAPRELGARRAADARRRWPRPWTACSATALATRPRPAARAVERFALEPWLDRHAELFERLAPR